ncbi:MAG: V-type ATP synthase subunit E [Oscillospiraceae bacterium]|nr:V-type ATP synthase subunit E [Oscillospiraceae bacterium]
MTGLEKITTQIIDDAKASAQKARTTAEEEAAKILASAKAQREAQAQQQSEETQAQAAAIAAHAQSGAALKKRQILLAAKQQIISETIQAAQESLLALDGDAYFSLIFKMAGKFALPQQGKLILNDRDLARAPKDFDARLKAAVEAIPGAALSLSGETRPINGGFVLDYDGIEENCSFEALFYSSQEALQDKVQEFLFQ